MATRWLNAHEQAVWRSWLCASRLLSEQLDRELQHNAGMPHAYYEILVRLSEAPERTLRMSELAKQTLFSRSRLSHAVTRLEEAGWVRRSECVTDKRGAMATLTEKGFSVLEAAAPDHVEGVRTHLFDQLTDEQLDQLGEISDVITRHLNSVRNDEAQC